MPQTSEVEEFLKSIGPFYEIAESDEEEEEEEEERSSMFTPNEIDDVTGELPNQSLQGESHDWNIKSNLDINSSGNCAWTCTYITILL